MRTKVRKEDAVWILLANRLSGLSGNFIVILIDRRHCWPVSRAKMAKRFNAVVSGLPWWRWWRIRNVEGESGNLSAAIHRPHQRSKGWCRSAFHELRALALAILLFRMTYVSPFDSFVVEINHHWSLYQASAMFSRSELSLCPLVFDCLSLCSVLLSKCRKSATSAGCFRAGTHLFRKAAAFVVRVFRSGAASRQQIHLRVHGWVGIRLLSGISCLFQALCGPWTMMWLSFEKLFKRRYRLPLSVSSQ